MISALKERDSTCHSRKLRSDPRCDGASFRHLRGLPPFRRLPRAAFVPRSARGLSHSGPSAPPRQRAIQRSRAAFKKLVGNLKASGRYVHFGACARFPASCLRVRVSFARERMWLAGRKTVFSSGGPIRSSVAGGRLCCASSTPARSPQNHLFDRR